jgi:hypothetical protein
LKEMPSSSRHRRRVGKRPAARGGCDGSKWHRARGHTPFLGLSHLLHGFTERRPLPPPRRHEHDPRLEQRV